METRGKTGALRSYQGRNLGLSKRLKYHNELFDQGWRVVQRWSPMVAAEGKRDL